MAQDLPFWRPLPDYDAGSVNLDFSARGVESYIPPYTAPAAGSVTLDFWGDYTPGEALDLRLSFQPTVYRYDPPDAAGVDLDFDGDYTVPAAGEVHLAFGGEGATAGDEAVELRIDAQLPPLQASVTLRAVQPLRVAAQLNTLGASVALASDINVYRDPSHLAASGWEQAGRVSAATASGYRQSQRRYQQTESRYQHADTVSCATRAPAGSLPRARRGSWIVQEQADPLRTAVGWRNQYLPRVDALRRLRAQSALPLWAAAGVSNWYMPHLRTQWGLPYEQASRILARHWGDSWQHGEFWHGGTTAPYEQATQPPPGTSPTPEPPTEPEEPGWPELPEFFRGSPDLNLCRRLPVDTGLDLGGDPCSEPPATIPIQRTYLVSNSASLTLVATGQTIEVAAMSVAIDADSWAWELRATVVGEPSIALVRDAEHPAEVEATINGRIWRCVLDDWRRDRAWGNMPSATLSARSLAAYLGAPHAAARSYTETQTRTAQQLAEQELPIGWTLDWQIDDWLVEPEAWHYTERTPIEAITFIATAAGAVVQAHPSEPQLIIAPRYAVPHWAWDAETPDVTLPLDILTRLGSEYRPTEALNGVYVSGETVGVLALVKRTGTAGDRLAPMIVDPLTTRSAAARGRGIAVLSATGPQSRESLVLPLADDLAGLLTNGQLLRVDPTGSDWRGLVRSVSVTARLEGAGTRAALVVDQTVDVERHLEETA